MSTLTINFSTSVNTTVGGGAIPWVNPDDAVSGQGSATCILGPGERTDLLTISGGAPQPNRVITAVRAYIQVETDGSVDVNADVLLDGAVEASSSVRAYENGEIEIDLGFSGDVTGVVVGCSVWLQSTGADLAVGVSGVRLEVDYTETGAATHRPSAPHMQQMIRKGRR